MADPIQQLELYTYSIVWLALSIVAIVASQRFSLLFFRKLGFVILAFVVLKAFLIDMANLEGLYRALSFIGLGLSLVGIGWLFQKLQMAEIPIIDSTTSVDSADK